MMVVTEQMREQLRKLSQSVYDKMKRCRKLEKSTWKNLADVVECVEEIYRRIDQVTVDLVCIHDYTLPLFINFISRKIDINQSLTFENLVLVWGYYGFENLSTCITIFLKILHDTIDFSFDHDRLQKSSKRMKG